MNDTISIVLFSGTEDKLEAAAVLAAGAAAMERDVNVFLQYWALDAFRAGGLDKDRGVVAEAGAEGAAIMRRAQERTGQRWFHVMEQAKSLGGVSITACALSMDHFGLTKEDLDPMVDGVEGVASFMATATGAVVFI